MTTPAMPTGLIVQQGNRNAYVSWDLSAGATSYSLQRSTDQITYTTIASPTALNYLDTSVSIGVEYFYQVAGVNTSGTGLYCSPLSVIPSPTAEMSLGQLRLMSQQKADRVNSDFVSTSEWNNYINLAMFELYDLLVDSDPDLFTTTPYSFTTDGSTYLYPLPNGVTYSAALPFYKLMGVDLSVNSNTNNAWVTMPKFNFIDRNKFIYPNTSSTMYGVFNLRYRLVGQNLELIPTPTANQSIRVWYVPRLTQLLQDTDITTIGYSGWLQYVIVRAAKYALDKEESDTQPLTQEILFLKQRIEDSAANRDEGRPDTISDVQSWGSYGNWGSDGFKGGF